MPSVLPAEIEGASVSEGKKERRADLSWASACWVERFAESRSTFCWRAFSMSACRGASVKSARQGVCPKDVVSWLSVSILSPPGAGGGGVAGGWEVGFSGGDADTSCRRHSQ